MNLNDPQFGLARIVRISKLLASYSSYITLSKKVIKRYKVLSKKCTTKSIFHLKNESARFCIKDAHSSVQSRLLDDDGQMVEDHKVILAGSGH